MREPITVQGEANPTVSFVTIDLHNLDIGKTYDVNVRGRLLRCCKVDIDTLEIRVIEAKEEP